MRIAATLALVLVACGPQSQPQEPSSQWISSDEERPDGDAAAAEVSRQQAARERAAMRREIAELRREVEGLRERLGDAPTRPRPFRPSRPRPNPADTYAIPVAGFPALGNRDALVTIVKAYEFACPFCNKVRATLDQLRKDYGGELRIVYRNTIVHPQHATTPALAACAAQKQGAWKGMHDLIWKESFASRDFSEKKMESYAVRLKLDIGVFRASMQGTCKSEIRVDQAELSTFGVTGTPAFFINGRYLSGAQPIDRFKKLIDEELAQARRAMRKDPSLTRLNYYQREILGRGKTTLDPVP
jgi:protein-disulfide isomerase